MNDEITITSYVFIDDVTRSLHHRSHSSAKVTDAEVLTVAVVAAEYFHNNHERALWVLTELGYLSERLSTSRFNRRLHAVADWLRLRVAMFDATGWDVHTRDTPRRSNRVLITFLTMLGAHRRRSSV